ncbi:hypothetical protein D5045_22385 [Verminephrobacter eiseniae]|nr:hypothetical protein [Verminephrobacter eiseniae]
MRERIKKRGACLCPPARQGLARAALADSAMPGRGMGDDDIGRGHLAQGALVGLAPADRP